jgi:flagellar hook-associated protein FlgK
MGGNVSTSSLVVRLNSTGYLDATFNGASVFTLTSSTGYTEGAAAVVLDSSVMIYDMDLAALINGFGNYAGASVTIARDGGADATDIFSARGNLSFDLNGDVTLSSVKIGTFTQDAGTLVVTFNSNATQARVNEALSNIGYRNTSDAPPASLEIAWTFSDGNTGVQGDGGPLTTTGYTTVYITLVNDAPAVVNAIADQAAQEDAPFSFTIPSGAVVDPDGDTLTYAAKLANGDPLPAWLSFDAVTRTFSGTPANGDVGKISVTVTATDGSSAAVSDTFEIAVANVNDAPTISGTIASQADNDTSSVSLFSNVTVGDVDSPAQTLTVSVALDDAAKGIFTSTSLSASGFTTSVTPGVYTFTGTAAEATTAIRKLVFNPTDTRPRDRMKPVGLFTQQIVIDDHPACYVDGRPAAPDHLDPGCGVRLIPF